ncbi:MAG: SulP family inorganic anion transporter [Verrucomicrobiota bacterium]
MTGFRKSFARFWKGPIEHLRSSRLQGFPIYSALNGYQPNALQGDLRAGLNVALLAFPQGLAYAVIAGLPIVYGVTCSAVAAIVAPLFASSRYTILGPTNATALVVFTFFAVFPGGVPLPWMPFIVLMSGLFLIVGAIFRVADLIQFISRSVVVGYISAAAILIILNQLKSVLGVDTSAFPEGASQARSFVALLRSIPSVELLSLGISLVTLLVYVLLTRYLPKFPGFALTLAFLSLGTWALELLGVQIPTFRDQVFSVWDDKGDFRPQNLLPSFPPIHDQHWFDQISQFLGLSFAIAFLSALENSVMAQTLGSKTGTIPDKNQDMFSVGMSNVATAFLSGMPASGSLTRSALNHASGAVTPLSSILSGILCLIGAFTLGGVVAYVPKASLAVLVIAIACSLWNPRRIRMSLNSTGSDAAVFLVTFLSAFFVPLHVAVFAGVGTSIALYLRKASKPYLVEYTYDESEGLQEMGERSRQTPQISIVHVEGELFFGAAELFRSQIQRTCHDPNLRLIILQMRNARHLDATSVMALEELLYFLRSQDRHLLISGAQRDVREVLENSGVIEVIGEENIIEKDPLHPNRAMRHALQRAQEVLGTHEVDIRIYFDPQEKKGEG